MLIWRLETATGTGYYYSNECQGLTFQDEFRHPVPSSDKVRRSQNYLAYYIKSEHRFGFTSIKLAREWFNKPKMLLKLAQVKLVAYDTYTDLRAAEQQCIFIPNKLRKRAEFKASELYTLSARKLHKLAREQLEQQCGRKTRQSQ